MDNSIYINLSNQLALFRDMDITASNIANANTTGYNAQHIVFSSFLGKDINQGAHNAMAMANDINAVRNLDAGPLKSTNNPLDIAIQGQGYFAVETPLGTRYTRAGNFSISPEGTLTTPEGYPVLDNSGQQIEFPEGTSVIDIGSVGNIKIDGQDFATIGVSQFSNEQMLERQGNNLFKSDEEPQIAEEGFKVAQGMLEGSNVQPVLEMTHMIAVSRAVTNTAKFIETMYELQRKASNTWAQQG